MSVANLRLSALYKALAYPEPDAPFVTALRQCGTDRRWAATVRRRAHQAVARACRDLACAAILIRQLAEYNDYPYGMPYGREVGNASVWRRPILLCIVLISWKKMVAEKNEVGKPGKQETDLPWAHESLELRGAGGRSHPRAVYVLISYCG